MKASPRRTTSWAIASPPPTNSGGLSCSELLAAAGVARVVVAAADSSPFASGRGVRRLREAGVATDLGLLSEEAAGLYAAYRP